MILTLEGCFSSDKLVDCDSNWPQVNFFIIASTCEDLRCQVKIRPYYGQHISPLSSLEGFFADTKVNNLQSFYQGVIEYILWLEISVHYIFACKHLKSLEHLLEILIHFRLWEMSILFDFLIKSTSIAILIEKVEVVNSFQNLYKLYYMRTVDLRQYLYFIESAFLKFRIFLKPSNVDNFDSYFSWISTIDSSINFTVL